MMKNKKVVITGAASGIGMEILKLISAEKTNTVLAVDRNIAPLEAMNKTNVIPYACDISIPENVDLLFKEVEASLGVADIFCANAGFAYYEKIRKADWEHIDKMLRVNTISPIYSYEKYCEQMGELPGHFVMTISTVGLMGMPGYAIYCTSKFALNGFHEAIQFERPDNIRFTSVYPISTNTKFFETANKNPFPKSYPVMEADVLARRIVKGIESGKKQIKPSRAFNAVNIIFTLLPFTKNLYRSLENKKFQEWSHKDAMSSKKFGDK